MESCDYDSSSCFCSFWYLLLLGFFGMCFSEVFSWNTRTITSVINRGMIHAILSVGLVWFIYTVLLSWFADLAIRHKVGDTTGLLLLGNIYGLINEGFFAQNLYFAPVSPLGVSPLFLVWPTLSWHPIIVALPTWFLFRSFVYHRQNWAPKSLSLRQSFFVVLFCGFWFLWQHAKWQQMWFPAGIELKVQILFLIFPLLAGGLLLLKTLRLSVPTFANGLMTVRQRRVVWVILGFAGINNLRLIPEKNGFLTVILLMIFYWSMFKILGKRMEQRGESAKESESNESASELNQPYRLQFPVFAFFQVLFLVVSTYVIFQIFFLSSGLKAFWAFGSMVCVFFAFIFSAGFPFLVLFRFFRMKSGKQRENS